MMGRTSVQRWVPLARWLGVVVLLGSLALSAVPARAQDPPQIWVHLRNHDWVQGSVAPDAWVEITLYDGGGAWKAAESGNADGSGWFGGWCLKDGGGNCVDITPDDQVQVVVDGSAPIVIDLFDISATVDSAADRFSGQIAASTLPVHARAEVWAEGGASTEFDSPDGSFDVTLDPGFEPGHWVNLWAQTPDGHWVGAVFSELRLEVNVSDATVDGITTAGETVALELYDAGDTLKGSATSGPADYEGHFWAGFPDGVEMAAGDRLTASVNPTAEVEILAVTAGADAGTDVVSGTAPPGTPLRVQPDGGPELRVDATPEGTYTADFGAVGYDLQDCQRGTTQVETAQGHQLRYGWQTPCAPMVRVQVSHDWVDGQAPLPNMPVTIRVLDALMAEKGAYSGTVRSDGWFGGWCALDPDGNCVDILAGDTVEVDMGGTLVAVPVVDLTAAVSAAADLVAGHVPGSAEGSRVRVEVWEPGGPAVDGTTDAAGDYSISLAGSYDLQEGHQVAVWAFNAEGHQVGIVRSALRLGINLSDDNVWGSTTPGAAVTVTASDGSGVKGSGTATADAQGNFWLELFDGGQRVDLLPGDTVEATNGVDIATVPVHAGFSAEMDAATDSVSGTGPAGARLQAQVYGYGDRWTEVAGDGTWSLAWDQDFPEDAQGDARYYTPEGHEVLLRFYGDFLQITVNQSHNWVNGETTPGSTVVATVWRAGVPRMSGSSWNGNGTGWHINFCCGEERSLRTGDVVEVTTSRGHSASIEIVPLSGAVDAVADWVTGQVAGVPLPAQVRAEVWAQGGPGVDGTTDGAGAFDFGLDGFDLLPGHMVFLAYVRPDGHRVGIIRHALLLRADTANDSLDGETAPNTDVAVQVDGAPAGSSTSDARGTFSMPLSADVTVGSLVEAQAGGQSAGLVVPEVSASVDEAGGMVTGQVPPGTTDRENVNVAVDGDWRSTRSAPDGSFSVDYGRDLTGYGRLEVNYQLPEGHEVRYRFGRADLWLGIEADRWNVVPGEQVPMRVRYGNDGGPALGAALAVQLPAGLSYVSDTSGLTPVEGPPGTFTWALGDLPPAPERRFELVLEMAGDVAWGTQLTVQAQIEPLDDRNPGNNQTSGTVQAWGPWPDRWVEKELVGDAPPPGGQVTYRLRYGNSGAADAPDATLVDTLPEGTTFVASTFQVPEDGESEVVGTGQVTWHLGTLAPGESHEFELTLLLGPELGGGGFLENLVEIDPDDEPDSWAERRNNVRRLNAQVQAPWTDLWVDKQAEGDLSTPGEAVYVVTFANAGNAPALDVSVADTLPPEAELLWYSAPSAATVSGDTVTWSLPALLPGASGEVRLGVRLPADLAPGTAVVNAADVTTATPELDTGNNHAEAVLGAPQVICVPWVGSDPHRVLSGVETTLKGIARGYGLAQWTWNPGDGSPPVTGWVGDPYIIEARHTYAGLPGDEYTATLTVCGAFGWCASDTYPVRVFDPIPGVRRDVAIDEALWYVHKSTMRSEEDGLPFARWEWGNNPVAVNSAAVQAFQVHGHRPGGDPDQDPYVEDVHSAWNAILASAVLDPMSLQPAGDPDGDGDGLGLGLYSQFNHSIYESGLALMALATTGTPERVAQSGPPGAVRGRTYQEIAQDMVDWFAWGQNDQTDDPNTDWARGGWRYQPNSGDSDNSNTQFPVLGLAAAEEEWGIAVPQFVKDELRDYWLVRTQCAGEPWDGGFGYTGCGDMVNVSKTGAGIMNLVWSGVPADDERVSRAVGYITAHWDDPMDDANYGGNVGDFYTMYAVKKGSQTAGFAVYGAHVWDAEYSDYLVDIQQPDGRFDEDPAKGRWFGSWQPMSTEWALLILSPGLYEALPVAIISPNQYGQTEPLWLEGMVQFDGTASRHTDPDRTLVGFEWDLGDGGTASGSLTPWHQYADNGDYLVTLTVTDDIGQSDTDTRLIHVDNVPPEVGPISAPGDPIPVPAPAIDVSASFTDPGIADTHVAEWDWDDGTTSSVDPATSPVAGTHTYTEPGVYEIVLTVTDDDGGVGTSTYQYVVVYDPAGGFVTGGGWILSPAGAYAPDPALEGRATFGFVSKYQRGARVPTGQTEFHFQVADLNFHSSSYAWLVVNKAGTNAQFKGWGTINGAPSPNGENYQFMLWAGDGSPDTFRIRIWWQAADGSEVVVYDNGTDQPIGGGSIVVHRGK